jgi:hypothetical protein
VVAQKPALNYASPLSVTWLASTVGAVSCLAYAPALVHDVVALARSQGRAAGARSGGS